MGHFFVSTKFFECLYLASTLRLRCGFHVQHADGVDIHTHDKLNMNSGHRRTARRHKLHDTRPHNRNHR